MVTPLPLRTRFLFRMILSVGKPQMIGPGRHGDLRIVPVTGGSFEGPELRGQVLPAAAGDWLRAEADGTAHLDVRLTMQDDRGNLIYCSYTGVRTGPEDVLARLQAGEAVDPESYYFRTAVRFETGATDLAWMNRTLAIGVGQRPPNGPTYDIYAVL